MAGRHALEPGGGTARLPTFDEAAGHDSFLGGGRFLDGSQTLNGIGVGSTSDGTWVTVPGGGTASLLTKGAIMMQVHKDLVPGGLDESNTEIAAVSQGSSNLFNYRDAGNSVSGRVQFDTSEQLSASLAISQGGLYTHSVLKVSHAGKGDWIDLVLTWNELGRFITYFDGLILHDTMPGAAGWDFNVTDPFDVLQFRDQNSLASLRNCAVLSEFLDTGQPRASIGMLGDSLMNFGGPPDQYFNTQTEKAAWMYAITEDMPDGPKGIDGSDGAAAESVNGKHYDAGALQQIIRTLSKHGIQTAGNLNYTKGGASTSQIRNTYLADMLAARVPDYIAMNAGQNDVTGEPFDTATFETALKGIIDDAAAAGVKGIALSNLTDFKNNSSFDSQIFDENTRIANGIIDEMPGYAASQGHGASYVEIADNFTAFGGLNATAGLQISNDVHHTTAGSAIFGQTIGDALTRLIK